MVLETVKIGGIAVEFLERFIDLGNDVLDAALLKHESVVEDL